MADRLIHLRDRDLGMRPMQGDQLARQYRERWYSTLCGKEARNIDTSTHPIPPTRLWRTCPACAVAAALAGGFIQECSDYVAQRPPRTGTLSRRPGGRCVVARARRG